MKKLSEVLNRGAWISEAILHLNDVKKEELIPCFFEDLIMLEKYLETQKNAMINEILILINSLYYWRETGDTVIFDDDFFDYFLSFKQGKKSFFLFLKNKKFDTQTLSNYYLKLTQNQDILIK